VRTTVKYKLVARNEISKWPFILIGLLFMIPGLVVVLVSLALIVVFWICTWPFAKFVKKVEVPNVD